MRASWQKLVGSLASGTWLNVLGAAGVYGTFGAALLVVAVMAGSSARKGDSELMLISAAALLFACAALYIVAAAATAGFIKLRSERQKPSLAPVGAGPRRITQVHVGFRDEA